MALPKQHKTGSKARQRRSQIFLKEKNFVTCTQCKQKRLSHSVCLSCGTYRGRQVIEIKQPKEKKGKK